jgi:DNA replication initiation complex subunit (GINS family)
MKAIIRQAGVNCRTPYKPTDEEYQNLVNSIRDNVISCATARAYIEKTKADLKDYEQALEGAEKDLAAGKDGIVPCTLHIRHDDNTVRIQRNDTGEWLPERNITDEDRQTDMNDKEVEEA